MPASLPPIPDSPSVGEVPEAVVLGVSSASPQGVTQDATQGVTQASWVAPTPPPTLPPSPPLASPPGKPEPDRVASELQTPAVAPPVSDISAQGQGQAQAQGPAGFGHAPDYSWVTGELEHIRARNVWRLRYAPADQEDRFGGTVLLVGDGLPAERKNGQIVRVEGQLVNPETTEARPPYWVRSFQVLKASAEE
jgi:hypothetical protein